MIMASSRSIGAAAAARRALAFLLTCLCGWLMPSAASAQVPGFWSSVSSYGSACTLCHLTPPKISTSGADARITSPMTHLSTAVLQSDSAFKTYFGSFASPKGSPMSTFCTNVLPTNTCIDHGNQNDWDTLRQYLMDVVDLRVTSPMANISPVPSNTATTTTSTVNFGTVLANNNSSAATFTVQNGRYTSVTLNMPTVSGSDTGNFVIGTRSCSVVTGNYVGSCTFTVNFSAGSTPGSKSTTLLISYSAPNAGDPTPTTRRVLLQGFTNVPPLANAGSNQSVNRGTTVLLSGSLSRDDNGDALTYGWSFQSVPTGSAAALSNSAAVAPTFVADKVGSYSLRLTVTDSRGAASTATVSVTALNNAPVANAGTDRIVNAPVTVNLNGSGSSDADGDPLSYAWVLSKPLGSTATLSNSSASQPSFLADKSGEYIATLTVNDGTTSSGPSHVKITAGNTPPIANAGPSQTVTAPVTVTLIGSATDANNDTVTFAWSFSSKPVGSSAVLVNANTAGASFNADKSGAYVLSLTVNDGHGGMDTKTVTITANNTPPVANAGGARTVSVRALVTINGSATDANNDTLAYAWALTTRPATSTAVLIAANTATPSFTPDLPGSYTAQLTVTDGQGGSHTDSAVFTAQAAPIANAGPQQVVVATGSTVTLDGTKSTTSTSGPLSYAWTLTSKPIGSTVALAGSTTARPTFVADLPGTFTASLQVSDSLATSSAVTVKIISDRPPVANAGVAQSQIIGNLVTLDGTGSTDADGDALSYHWTLTTRPAGSAAVLSSLTVAKPTFTPDIAGVYAVSLVVNDGMLSSAAASVVVTASNAPPLFTISASSLSPTAQLTRNTSVSALIGNGGGLPLILNSLAFAGSAASDYSLAASNTCTPALVLVPGASCTLVVSFAPTQQGSRAANLAVTHNAVGSPGSLALNGTGTPAPQGRIALSTWTLAFPASQVGSPTSLSATVQNSGDGPLTFSAFTLAGTAVTDFSRGGSCSTASPLAVGAQCALSVTFQPTAVGARSALLTIQSDASNGAATVALTGAGVPVPAPRVSLSEATLPFGAQTLGGLYPSRSVILSNSGTADLTLNAITVQGAGFADVSSNPCPVVLAAGASCTIEIRFAPTGVAAYFGSLQVNSNAAGSPSKMELAGNGTAAAAPALVWTPAVGQVGFGPIATGAVSASQSVTLRNQGPGGALVTLLNATGVDGPAFSVTSTDCAVGQTLFESKSCSIVVRFAPGSAGDKTAQLQVASTGSFPPAMTLSGTGLGGPNPDLTLSTVKLDFASTRVGAQSMPSELTLIGSGSGAVQVTSMNVTGPYVLQNKSCPAMPFTLSVGSECAVTVNFQPQGEGSAVGKLSITTDALPAVRDVALTGKGDKAADMSTGGCSISNGGGNDPTLWTLLLLALAALGYRARARRRTGRPLP